jgi:hypothetical protein
MTRIQAGPLHSLEETHTSDRGMIHGEGQESQCPYSNASLTRSATEWALR